MASSATPSESSTSGRPRVPSGTRHIPCVVGPQSLSFSPCDERTQGSLKQTLTLYNIYDFAAKFVIKCNAAREYDVRPARGVIPQHSSQDVIIRYKGQPGVPRRDIFKIEVQDDAGEFAGDKLIWSTVMAQPPHTRVRMAGEPAAQGRRGRRTKDGTIAGRGFHVSLWTVVLPLLGVVFLWFLLPDRQFFVHLLVAFLIGMLTMFLQLRTVESSSS